ncbi:MAG: DUF502 domain-containing protein [Methylococcaceae bacterium]|nr:DUF502 domain-containing protein [Methylococcaceae bacterium]MCI0667776.1 DUF502 domain-containing protein [Methylococcaceae bacterium]MCI0734102.1 DUF502 domain-containing protein [Methylococcaceae bacterium]
MSYIYRLFLKGLFTVLPVLLTFYLIYWIVYSVERLLNRYVVALTPDFLHFPGMGILAAVALLIGVGFLMNHFVSDRLSGFFENLLTRIPLIKTFYRPLKDLTHLFAKKPNQSMQRVVLITLPGLNIKLLGLVTRDKFDDLPDRSIPADHLAVYLPGSYFLGGVTLIVPKDQLQELDMPVEQAVKLALTGWIKGELSNLDDPASKRLT